MVYMHQGGICLTCNCLQHKCNRQSSLMCVHISICVFPWDHVCVCACARVYGAHCAADKQSVSVSVLLFFKPNMVTTCTGRMLMCNAPSYAFSLMLLAVCSHGLIMWQMLPNQIMAVLLFTIVWVHVQRNPTTQTQARIHFGSSRLLGSDHLVRSCVDDSDPGESFFRTAFCIFQQWATVHGPLHLIQTM